MSKTPIVLAVLTVALIHPSSAAAQTAAWRVIAGESGSVATPGLPAGVSRNILDYQLGDRGANKLGFRVDSPGTSAGYWAQTADGSLQRYTQLGVTGALGPARSGAESGHVFESVNAGWGGAAPGGVRVFLARAGAPGAPDSELSYGLWLFDGTRNLEMARTLTDGPLGPGLGAGWVFPNSSGFANSRMLSGGKGLHITSANSPTGANFDLVTEFVPGEARNVPCAMEGSTDPALAPGIAAGDTFPSQWSGSLDRFSVTAEGRVYAVLRTSTSGGIFELCSGAPRPIVVIDEAGVRGPDVAVATAYFTTLYAPVPGSEGTFFYFADYREQSGGRTLGSLFRYDGVRNQPLAVEADTGAYSPNWEGSTFSGSYSNLSTSGEYASFEASLVTADGGDPSGLFRVHAGEPPQPAAIIGIVGAYAPEANRTWARFEASAMLGNGDILLEAYTNPGNEYALWLLKPGQAPRRILRAGDSASVPTASGPIASAVSGFSLPNGDGAGAQPSRGIDSWIGVDGTILIRATVNTYGTVLMTAQPSNPVERIFVSGFDG